MSIRELVGALIFLVTCMAAPSGSQTTEILGSLPVTNFQDLSAILSLLAADTVEKKLSAEGSLDWERMSSVWSIFGIVGALRANLKVAIGLGGSEKAGVELHGAGGFTAYRTRSSLCYWQVGRSNRPLMWRDSTNQLLSRMEARNTPWTRPICIAIGYSRCPWDPRQWRCLQEVLLPLLWTISTMVIAILPSLILIPSLTHPELVHVVMLSLQMSTACLVGSVTPLLMNRLNSVGLAHLQSLPLTRSIRAGIVQDGDHVATSTKTGICHLIWQTPASEASSRTGDSGVIRLLCGLNAVIIIAAYIGNYIALGKAAPSRQYIWLGVQVVILATRFILWARRPVWSVQRFPCIVYIVCGSLGSALNAVVPDARVAIRQPHPKLDRVSVEFAIASTFSRQTNLGFYPGRLKRDVLTRLSGSAPADILHAEYISVGSIHPALQKKLKVVRLLWSFIEELYCAQGLILGNNPWAMGGLYLGAVLLEGTFVGLTTLHPFAAHMSECRSTPCHNKHSQYSSCVVSQDGYIVSDDTYGSVVNEFGTIESTLLEWHRKFRDNVEMCRRTARVNGPSHIEVHASTFGPVPILRVNQTRTESHLDLSWLKDVIEDARRKSHSGCDEWVCEVEGFGHGNLKVPRKPGR